MIISSLVFFYHVEYKYIQEKASDCYLLWFNDKLKRVGMLHQFLPVQGNLKILLDNVQKFWLLLYKSLHPEETAVTTTAINTYLSRFDSSPWSTVPRNCRLCWLVSLSTWITVKKWRRTLFDANWHQQFYIPFRKAHKSRPPFLPLSMFTLLEIASWKV